MLKTLGAFLVLLGEAQSAIALPLLLRVVSQPLRISQPLGPPAPRSRAGLLTCQCVLMLDMVVRAYNSSTWSWGGVSEANLGYRTGLALFCQLLCVCVCTHVRTVPKDNF